MITLLSATLISIIMVYGTKLIAVKIGAVDKVRADRWHRSDNIPRLAGPGIFLTLVPWVSLEELLILFLFCVIGIIDDLHSLSPLSKALLLSIPSILSGWLLGWWICVMCWLIANAFNLLDHADGIAGVVALTSLSITGSQFGMAGAGACLGFLFYNFPPARVFLGDGGSLMLGASIVLCWAPYGEFPLLLAVIVPLSEMTFVTFSRLLRGRKPWIGGTDHSGHILLRLGIPQKLLPFIYGGITFMFCNIMS